MFFQSSIDVDLPATAAAGRLTDALGRQHRSAVCDFAYADGLELLVRVGGFSALERLPKQVELLTLEPRTNVHGMRVGLRWMAADVYGSAFSALDADLEIIAQSE